MLYRHIVPCRPITLNMEMALVKFQAKFDGVQTSLWIYACCQFLSP